MKRVKDRKETQTSRKKEGRKKENVADKKARRQKKMNQLWKPVLSCVHINWNIIVLFLWLWENFLIKSSLREKIFVLSYNPKTVVRHCVEVRDLGRSLEISSTVKSRGTQMSSGSLACFCAAWFFDCTIQFPIPRQQWHPQQDRSSISVNLIKKIPLRLIHKPSQCGHSLIGMFFPDDSSLCQ